MKWNKVKVVYLKEMLDLFRDRRTIITSVLLPIILYPFLSIFVASVASRQDTKISDAVKTVYIADNVRSTESDFLQSKLDSIDTIELVNVEEMQFDEHFKEMIESNQIQAYISLLDSTRGEYKHIVAKVYFNDTDEKSQKTISQIKNNINQSNWELVSRRLEDLNLDKDFISALEFEGKNVAPPQKILGALLGKFLAYMLIILTLSSGAVVASDLVAGEKERGTLETILVSAVSRVELVSGKFLTIITFSFITVFMNIFSMYISTRHILGMANVDLSQVQIPFFSFILIFLAMIPLATLFAGIQLSLSTYSRNIKECSSYQMPLLIVGMMFSMISIFPGFELNYGLALIPIMNFSLLLKNILLGEIQTGLFLTVIFSNLLLAAMVLKLSVSLFNKEQVLFRTQAEKTLKFWGKKKRNIFEPGFTMFFFICVLLLFYYFGSQWQAKEIVMGLVKTELILILLPVLLLYRMSKTPILSAARIQGTKPVNLLLMLFAVIPMFFISIFIMQIINLLFPFPDSYLHQMQKLQDIHQLPLASAFMVIGILPGICEEMLFRGYIIRGFEKMGIRRAVIISGILFGIFHLDIFRLLPAAIMGIWLGYLLVRTGSILITIIAHMLHNSLTVVLSRWGESLPLMSSILETDKIPYIYVVISLILVFIIIRLIEQVNYSSKVESDALTGPGF